MFKTILNSLRNASKTTGHEASPFAVEAMESRTHMTTVTGTGGTFTLTFNGQTTPGPDDAPADTLTAGPNTRGILIGLLLPAVQKVR